MRFDIVNSLNQATTPTSCKQRWRDTARKFARGHVPLEKNIRILGLGRPAELEPIGYDQPLPGLSVYSLTGRLRKQTAIKKPPEYLQGTQPNIPSHSEVGFSGTELHECDSAESDLLKPLNLAMRR